MLKSILVIVISYLFGSIPWALVIGKVFYGKDIRKEGSGNLGASNAGRVLGKKAAISVTLLDALKALLSMYIASILIPSQIIWAGVACAFGHCFPLFAGFKGGKAVATTYGLLLGIVLLMDGSWLFNLVLPVVLFFVILYIGKIVSVASLSALAVESVAMIFVNGFQIFLPFFILWLFILYRHRSNIEKLIKGQENKVKWMG